MVPPPTRADAPLGRSTDLLFGRAARLLLGGAGEPEPAAQGGALLAQSVCDAVDGSTCVVARAYGPPNWELEVLGAAGSRAEALIGRRLQVRGGPLARALHEGAAVELTGANRVKGLFGPLDRVTGACRLEPVLGAGRQAVGLLIVTRSSTRAFAPEESEIVRQLSRLVPLLLGPLWTPDPLAETAREPAPAAPGQAPLNRLLTTAVQELHAPLASLRLALATGAAELAAARAAELADVVEDLRLATLLEAGGLQAAPVTVDLSELLRQALLRAEPRVRLRRGTITLRGSQRPVPVYADPEEAGRALDLLIEDALGRGRARPRVRLTLTSRSGVARLLVEDGARGPAFGQGLGVYLAHELARRQGGSVVAGAGRSGSGRTLLLSLPAHA
jgi:hypothetical protein